MVDRSQVQDSKRDLFPYSVLGEKASAILQDHTLKHVPYSKSRDSVQELQGTCGKITDHDQNKKLDDPPHQAKPEGSLLRHVKPHLISRSKAFSLSACTETSTSESPKLLKVNKKVSHTLPSIQHSSESDVGCGRSMNRGEDGSRWSKFLAPTNDLEDDSN